MVRAGQDSSAQAREAFGRLYQDYLPPLRAYLRRDGHTEDEAAELVQGFFEFLLDRKRLARVRREGKFRSWLLVCLKNYLADTWSRNHALKRGGHAPHVTLGPNHAEAPCDPPHQGRTPDQEYDFQFAVRFLELVMARLQREYQARGKGTHFALLHPFLLEKKGGSTHAQIGQQLRLSESAVDQEVSRLRKRYRMVFDDELAKLVGVREEIEEEKRFLFAALRTQGS